ncbi:hypothetical protein EVAR_23629_1 [Eumeta japonica]|uniref:Uncharacterized protein n=1 Tax=Eumeta variegata TaxID=151549 RepID=A0A4C1VHK3_EUMVA|nr:hypothetical protein EVAR_23629_1 [Eumeta japonica]
MKYETRVSDIWLMEFGGAWHTVGPQVASHGWCFLAAPAQARGRQIDGHVERTCPNRRHLKDPLSAVATAQPFYLLLNVRKIDSEN